MRRNSIELKSKINGIKVNGIYKIFCEDYVYVGSSSNISARINWHRSMLRANKHNNKEFQKIFNLFGIDKFYYEKMNV